MARETIAPALKVVRNHRRGAVRRLPSRLRPRGRSPISCAIDVCPRRPARAVALVTPPVGIRADKWDCHHFVGAQVTLETQTTGGMRRHWDVRLEAPRIPATFVARVACAGSELFRGQFVRDARRRPRIRAQVAHRFQRARVGLALSPSIRCDRHHVAARAEHLSLRGDRLSRRRRDHDDGGFRRGFATRRRPPDRYDHGGNGRDSGAAQKQRQQPADGTLVVQCHLPPPARRRSTRTAHLSASGCPERGQQASSVSWCTGAASSNDWTKS